MSRARAIVLFIPEVLMLFRRLLGDPRVPRRSKLWLGLLVTYLASPIDLIPDFLPVIGQLDDAALAVLALRSVVRGAGRDVVAELWPGSPAGLAVLLRVAG